MADQPTVPCQYCGTLTRMCGTRQCDGCWEIAHRVRKAAPDLLAKIIIAEATPDAVAELAAALVRRA